MIVRIPLIPNILEERLYDLSDGSLLTGAPIGMIYGVKVYSAEQLLTDLETYYDPGVPVSMITTGFTDEDMRPIA